jgi:hypothetical protein
METSLIDFQVAYNERKSRYEVHRYGCKHLVASHLDLMPGTYPATKGSEVKERFERENEECWTDLGPCAR